MTDINRNYRTLRHALINVRFAFALQVQPSGYTTCDALREAYAGDLTDYKYFATDWIMGRPCRDHLPQGVAYEDLVERWGVNILVPGFYYAAFCLDEPCQKATDLRIELLDAAIEHFTNLIEE